VIMRGKVTRNSRFGSIRSASSTSILFYSSIDVRANGVSELWITIIMLRARSVITVPGQNHSWPAISLVF
jgi:hypothetical protein